MIPINMETIKKRIRQVAIPEGILFQKRINRTGC